MYSPQPAKDHAPITFRWNVSCGQCHGYGWYTRDGYDEVLRGSEVATAV